jgi:hypothetical protein
MAEQNQVSGNPESGEELPTPSFSSESDSSPSDQSDVIVSKLLPHLEQMIEKKVQSTKDKRFSEIEKVLGGRGKILAELESDGVNISQEVRTKMELRELREQIAGQSAQPAPAVDNGLSTQKAAVTEAIATLNQYGLSSNDPAFIELLRGKYSSRDAFDKAVLGHVVGKLAPQKPPNPADVVQSPVTSPATVSDTASKIARLTELQKQPTKYRKEIAELAAELDKAGWK